MPTATPTTMVGSDSSSDVIKVGDVLTLSTSINLTIHE